MRAREVEGEKQGGVQSGCALIFLKRIQIVVLSPSNRFKSVMSSGRKTRSAGNQVGSR